MKKIETIWHQLLFEALEKHVFKHTQQELAQKTGFSLSTVNLAIAKPAKIGAIRKESKFFVVEDIIKFLYFWGSVRNLHDDIIFQTLVETPVLEIEGMVPASCIFGGYSAARRILDDVPADYDKVYIYDDKQNLKEIESRYPKNKRGTPNFFVLEATPEIRKYGQLTTLAQTFVDIWNLSDWFAKDYLQALEEKINGILS